MSIAMTTQGAINAFLSICILAVAIFAAVIYLRNKKAAPKYYEKYVALANAPVTAPAEVSSWYANAGTKTPGHQVAPLWFPELINLAGTVNVYPTPIPSTGVTISSGANLIQDVPTAGNWVVLPKVSAAGTYRVVAHATVDISNQGGANISVAHNGEIVALGDFWINDTTAPWPPGTTNIPGTPPPAARAVGIKVGTVRADARMALTPTDAVSVFIRHGEHFVGSVDGAHSRTYVTVERVD